MSRELTRRTMLQLLGGVTAGAILSPLPWKVLDDAAIWTQNWSWLPKTPRGKLGLKRSTCTLCPAGCGLLARCVGERPYQLVGLSGHPAGGALCPLGLSAHHLATHPLRLRHPVLLDHASDTARAQGLAPAQRAVDFDQAVETLAGWLREAQGAGRAAGNSHAVVLLEPRADRVQSLVTRRFLGALGYGTHASCDPDDASMAILRDMIEVPPPSAGSASKSKQADIAGGPLHLGWDLERTRTILSFGAPLLEGWIAPGRAAARLVGRETLGDDERPLLLQVETRPSRTAMLADRWIPIAAGSEATLALGLAHVIVTEGRYDRAVTAAAQDFSRTDGRGYVELVLQFPPERVSQITGIAATDLRELARTFASRGPAVAVAGADPGGGRLGPDAERAIWSLNLLAGSIGAAGGFVARRPLPTPTEFAKTTLAPSERLEQVPDGSVQLLMIDAGVSGNGIPWSLLHRKLAKGAHVVSLSPFAGGLALHADMIVPAAAPLEELEEVPTPFLAPAASLALAPALLPRTGESMGATSLLARLCDALSLSCGIDDGCLDRALAARIGAVHAAGQGWVYRGRDGARLGMADIASPEELRELLADGGCWVDAPCDAPSRPSVRLLGTSSDGYDRLARAATGPGLAAPGAGGDMSGDRQLLLMPFAWKGSSGADALPPLISKLCRESALRPAAGQAWMHPDTARTAGLRDREPAVLESDGRSARVMVRCDAAVLPGMVHVAVGPCDLSFGDCRGGKPGARADRAHEDEAVLALCPPDEDCTWRLAKATARRA